MSSAWAGEWQRWTYDLWSENVIDAEHDSAALAVSFLLVQSCRFAFSGQLADEMTPGQKKSQRTIEELPERITCPVDPVNC